MYREKAFEISAGMKRLHKYLLPPDFQIMLYIYISAGKIRLCFMTEIINAVHFGGYKMVIMKTRHNIQRKLLKLRSAGMKRLHKCFLPLH